MRNESESFRKADDELGVIWKSLRKKMQGDFWDKTLNEQRHWVKSGRDEVAKEFMKAGLSKNGAYTRATIRRLHELQAIEYNSNLSERDLERGTAKADSFFYTEKDDPSYFAKTNRTRDAVNQHMNYTVPQRTISNLSNDYNYPKHNYGVNGLQHEEYPKGIGAENDNLISIKPLSNTPRYENVQSEELSASQYEYKFQNKRSDPTTAALMGGVKGAAFAIFACLVSIFIMLFMWIFKYLKNKSKILLDKSIEKLEKEGDYMQNENTGTIQKWYNNMTSAQRMYVYIVSFLLIFIYGIGLIPLSILIYCKLGTRKSNSIDTTFNDGQYDERDENKL